MKPWETVAEAKLGRATLTLRKRESEFLVLVDGRSLMGSRQHGSEEALAKVGCEGLGAGRPSVLVGGLGFGYTVRAALEVLPPHAELTVAELAEAMVEWNRGLLAELAGRPLEDPRVVLQVGDVLEVVRAKAERFDAILLDVDNGPYAVSQPGNATLYDLVGLSYLHRALKPKGRVAIWSAGGDARFVKRMEEVGFTARVTGTGRGRHVIFVGEKDRPKRSDSPPRDGPSKRRRR